ncbi:MAG TPA: 4Fe-4S dicluster domain-containing protein [bacterium]|nr:4Fe-4S dicluster domain-containing protein [bacterium]
MLLINIDKCYACRECKAECSYPLHPQKSGFQYLLEQAIRLVTCRHCDDAPCVISCPTGSLRKLKGSELERSSFLCISCKNCLFACPFGVNVDETVVFKTSRCDLCAGRKPVCLDTCTDGAVSAGEFKEDPQNGIYKLCEGVFVKGTHWQKQLGLKEKKIW